MAPKENGFPWMAFVCTVPSRDADAAPRLLVTSTVESFRSLPELREWCQTLRTQALEGVDAQLRPTGVLHFLRRFQDDYEVFRDAGST